MSAEITQITADSQGRFSVKYTTSGFSELPGTHLHFFFDTVPPDQVGMSGGGNRLMYGGPSPFTGFLTSDIPIGAKQICVLVADPGHNVIGGSGNCLTFSGSEYAFRFNEHSNSPLQKATWLLIVCRSRNSIIHFGTSMISALPMALA